VNFFITRRTHVAK